MLHDVLIPDMFCDAPFVPYTSFLGVSVGVDSTLEYNCVMGHTFADGTIRRSVVCLENGTFTDTIFEQGCQRTSDKYIQSLYLCCENKVQF